MKKVSLLLIVIVIALAGSEAFCQNVRIPDANFKNALLANTAINTNRDSEITVTEAKAFGEEINVHDRNIGNLTGIEAFVNITELRCSNNQLTSLDVRQNTALTLLYCSNNQLKSLDVRQNTQLTILLCSDNQLKALDVRQNTRLTNLDCSRNQLKALDVSKNTILNSLTFRGNQLKALDVRQNTFLTFLNCSSNQLKYLDVSQNTFLTLMNCSDNQLKTLNLKNGHNSKLKKLFIEGNPALVHVQVDDPTTFKAKWGSEFTKMGISRDISFSEDPIVPVSRIDVAGEGAKDNIDSKGGNLQMIKVITPSNASNQEVTWSVDDTDVATINAAGLLTAVSNGTVTVKATAQDASGTTGTKRITISNQRSAVVTSIADDRIESQLILYPNPTGDMLTIATSELVIEPMTVTDVAGNTVSVLAKDARHVDVSLLQAGTYLLHVKTEIGSRFSKFVKQ